MRSAASTDLETFLGMEPEQYKSAGPQVHFRMNKTQNDKFEKKYFWIGLLGPLVRVSNQSLSREDWETIIAQWPRNGNIWFTEGCEKVELEKLVVYILRGSKGVIIPLSRYSTIMNEGSRRNVHIFRGNRTAVTALQRLMETSRLTLEFCNTLNSLAEEKTV